ncbi:MAG TPA: NAD(P)-dependent oxidoreductase [Gaiellaceae bacterium]|nr:NAD(P)-dependent oxidoreductase [Gaiellaceae bacterium]
MATVEGRVCVTGAGGQAGRAVVRDLLEHGYDVAATDLLASREDLEAGMLRADLTDYGQALGALEGAAAVVHLANIPAPGLSTPAVTFNENTTMNFNVFHAAARLRLQRVIWASSETTLGVPFGVGPSEVAFMEADGPPPRYSPVDEDHYPVPTTAYALSKVASETVAREIANWSGIPFVALRFSNIMAAGDYEEFPSVWSEPVVRKWNLWGYVDARDVAAACRLALEAPPDAVAGSPSFVVAAADTVMNRPSLELLDEVFPDVPLRREIGEFDSLLATDRAREAIGYEPHHSWREHLSTS